MTTYPTPDFATALATYHRATEAYIGADPGRLALPGTTVHPLAERDGSGVASAYRIAGSTTIRCANRHAGWLGELAGATTIDLDVFDRWCGDRGGELLGGGLTHLLSDDRPPGPALPPGSTLRSIDRDDPSDVADLGDFLRSIDPDDVDAAEVDIDDIDPAAVLALDPSGAAAAFASWRPWEDDDRFCDIGIVTGPHHRREGWGRAAVSAVIEMAFERGYTPMYRHNDDNLPSHRLAVSLGFTEVARLRAWTLPDPPENQA